MPEEWSDRRDALPQGYALRDYTVEEVLGHGGFGIVYKARHNELDHVVAIKEYLPSELAVREGTTVRARSADSETQFADGLRRFREEARALIGFQQNPSIVDCRAFFRANGTAYLIMEYVEGLSLSEVLRQREAAGKPFTEADLLSIALPLAEGLAHIHRAGVIHRDVKPANILVRTADQLPVLIDFGAAKQAVAEHSRSLAPYTEGYAALEQVADGQLGPWTDLYGFGAVLWRMVAGGNRPWDPPNPVKVESRANARVREADDPLPTAKGLGTGRFAEQLLDMIDGCLRLRDTERIRESDRVVQMLQESCGESQQSAAGERQAEVGHGADRPDPVSEGARTGRPSKGRSWKVVGAVAAIAVVVALSTLALIPGNRTVETPDRWSFSIEPEPSMATVNLLSGPEEYRPGMLLAPGQYEIEVSAPGFVTRREWVNHSESETLHQVDLEPLPAAEPESVQTPSDSTPSDSAPSDSASEVAASTIGEPEQVPPDVSQASESIDGDPVVAENQESADIKAESQSTCGVGSFEDCFELGESYRKGDGVPRDARRAAEFYERACDGGYAPGCYNLGKSYSEGEGVGQDWAQAAELYWRACEGGYGGGCNNLGHLYAEALGVPVDRGRAAEFYERACDDGFAEGCYNLGDSYTAGEGVGQDWAQAAELYRRACSGDVALGCYKLAILYSEGQGVGQNWAQAAELYGRACGAGYAEGCYSLGYLYAGGQGVRKDWTQAAELYWRACEGGYASGCNNLGLMYADGQGVLLDRGRAAALYQRACDGGHALGCRNLGYLYSEREDVGQNWAQVAELYRQACEGQDVIGCYNLGYLYAEGMGVAQDRVRAMQLYQRTCDAGYAMGCYNLGVSYFEGAGVPVDEARAAQLYQRACDGGVTGGCLNLGNLYFDGKGVHQDLARAAELFRRACDGDDMIGCHNLGLSYYYGNGIGQDTSVAEVLLQKACRQGDDSSCEKLDTLDWR